MRQLYISPEFEQPDGYWQPMTRLKSLLRAAQHITPERQRTEIMAELEKVAAKSKRGKKGGTLNGTASFTEFVNIRLAPEFEAQAEKYSASLEMLTHGLVALTESGYKVTLSYDFQRGNHICTLTCRNEESVNSGKTMSSFGSCLQDAIGAALAKHFDQTEAIWKADDAVEKRRFG